MMPRNAFFSANSRSQVLPGQPPENDAQRHFFPLPQNHENYISFMAIHEREREGGGRERESLERGLRERERERETNCSREEEEVLILQYKMA